MNANIKGTDVSLFGILDGHGGEFAAVFAKKELMEKLTKKIEEATSIATGKTSPPPVRRLSRYNIEDQDTDEVNANAAPKLNRKGSQRRNTLKKALSTDDDCNPAISNCNKEQESFLSKLSSIRLTKESLLKTNNKVTKPTEREASYYVDRDNKINFGKMITDLVLLTDYELVEKAKRQVSNSAIQF